MHKKLQKLAIDGYPLRPVETLYQRAARNLITHLKKQVEMTSLELEGNFLHALIQMECLALT